MWTLTDIKEHVKLLKYFKSQGVIQENIIGQKGFAEKKKVWESLLSWKKNEIQKIHNTIFFYYMQEFSTDAFQFWKKNNLIQNLHLNWLQWILGLHYLRKIF